jgi:predicted O-linked N-acetylglucosamine transferase (SPINDLY family)
MLTLLNEIKENINKYYQRQFDFNNKDLLSRYGKLSRKIMADWQLKNNVTPIFSSFSEKIKIGIVGEQIRNHSVWNAITKGLVLNLDPSQFELHIFHLGSVSDHETEFAKSKSSTYTKDQSSLHGWASEIIKKHIEVLIYPEIGMHALTTQLANLRLAPIQLVTWGHPETSGLPTIDFYLSGDLFETEVSQNAYLEKLIKLPNLGCCYSPMPIVSDNFDLTKYDVDANEPILICAGTLFKYLPDHDWVWVELAKKIGNCKLIFFEMQEYWSSILKARLEKLFIKANLNIEEFILFIPRLPPNEFYGLLKKSDVFLDSIGFSGFNTAMQAVDCALPVVTRASEFMRGSLASGILKRMGMSDLITSTNMEYIELAVRLAQNKPYQNEIRNRLVISRDILYDDLEPIRALEEFLIAKTRGQIYS